MTSFSVKWADHEGLEHQQTFKAKSPTEAISLALEETEILRLYPDLIIRVTKED